MMPISWLTPSHFVIIGLQIVFAIAHSGGAALRPRAEKYIGARLYRIIFALVSLPLAVLLIIYFFRHRYDGLQLWQVQGVPGVREFVWILSAISFLFLYPGTFNLLEIAAIQKPEVRLYETGIMRITRHPQMVGQIIWCIAHTLWLGTTFTVVTSIGLILHHLFGVWHGDRRLSLRYGEAFEMVKQRTSIIPFKAILDGRQSIKWQEFIRPAYLGVAIFVALFWWSHPLLLEATGTIKWEF
ncbi:MAG: NnrU family protein [Nostoc sp. ChiSLP02]|nr:NnrU family protein [Nostoc sp. DedSLP05]MDZ8103741.1 NnrU family protein [Nostoc sp. DedSLP01]MDZ8184316.1 NnrU family protein [Nostoc sp. ChiSLP02]